jgi:uncharacterized protein YjgD (DUF1641 family)
MLDHLIDFSPPVDSYERKAVRGLDASSPEEILNAQVKTTEWLESMGVDSDQKVLEKAQATAARKVFAALATAQPVAETKHQLTQLKTPEAVRHLVTMLSAYDWEFVEQAKELRGMAVAKILEETNHPDARIRLKALDMLGRVTEVGLFTERIEVKRSDLSDNEIDQKIKDKLNRFMGVTDAALIEDIEEVSTHKQTEPTTLAADEAQRPDALPN